MQDKPTTKRRNQNRKWERQIGALTEYCQSKSWTVAFKKLNPSDDYAAWDKKRIVLSERKNKEILFYVFLHEIGHMLQHQNARSHLGSYEEVPEHFCHQAQASTVAKLEEELDAWKTGYRLADRLELFVDRRQFERVKAGCIMSYVDWGSRRHARHRQKQD